MKDHTAFSSDALRIITRLSRQFRQLDGVRSSMSSKEDGLWLMNRAAMDSRPEITAIAEELLQSLKAEEQAYLESHGVNLGNQAKAQHANQSGGSTKTMRRVYRGKVFYEEVGESDAPPVASGEETASQPQSPRFYRGQVLD